MHRWTLGPADTGENRTDEVPALWELRETEKPNPKHFSTDEEFWSEGREDVPLGRPARRGTCKPRRPQGSLSQGTAELTEGAAPEGGSLVHPRGQRGWRGSKGAGRGEPAQAGLSVPG